MDGDRAVRLRSFSGQNRRSRLLGRRRVPVAMVRAGVGRTLGGDRRVVQATLEAGRPTVAGGRDPGYPALLAVTFAFGGGLVTVVNMQQAAWVLLILVLAATAQAATRNAGGLVPIVLVATFPPDQLG